MADAALSFAPAPADTPRARSVAGRRALWLMAAALLAVSALWLFQGLGRGWAFILELRAEKLAGMLIIGAAVSVATVLFQTVSRNRILTPQIMGFDALYMLGQVLMISGLGIAGYAAVPVGAKFLGETVVMTAAALALFGTLLTRAGSGDVARMILTGVILGVLFRSLGGLVQRAMDPNDFAMVQAASFASFSRIDGALLIWAAPIALLAMGAAWRLSARLDVLALGRDPAVSLGLAHDRVMVAALSLTAVLVAVSTALVGPVAFLGLITAGLGRALAGTARHARLLPAAALTGAVLVVGGQLLFERFLGLAGTLSVVIEFAGGLVFLWLLLKGRVR